MVRVSRVRSWGPMWLASARLLLCSLVVNRGRAEVYQRLLEILV